MAEYIIREQAKQAIYEYILQQTVSKDPSEELCKASRMGAEGAMYEIDYVPAADVVEVKYGYWEIVKGSNGKEKMVCTNCRHQQDLHSTFTYCPNCGALIDGRVIHNG